MTWLFSIIQLIASAGGGGSGGGGGGGGSGGGSGEGGIFVLAFLVGYVPMHLLGRTFRLKQSEHQDDIDWWTTRQAITWMLGIVYATVLLIVGIMVISADAFLLEILFLTAAVGSLIGTGAGLYNWFGKMRRNKREEAELKASGWDEVALTEGAKRVFLAYQKDWSNNNVVPMAEYLTPRYLEHAKLMVAALQQIGRRNHMDQVQITEALITEVDDHPDDTRDSFVVGFTAHATDQIVDIATNTVMATNPAEFTEFWRFQRVGNSWKLDGIQPATANEWSHNPTLEDFAINNGLYYSLDWGWLLLPRRGQLFAGGTFGRSDINNHCIGWVQGTHDKILTQIYTYAANPAQNLNTYLIAQATLPKSYGDIVVRRRKGAFQFKIKGLKKVSTEWTDFNKMYQVFATSPEQATSLELLNPKYMEQLAAVQFEINIEVVDNVVYIYSPIKEIRQVGKKANDSIYQTLEMANKYQTVLWALQAAFKEMKM